MADNPFARFATSVPGTSLDENPFASFAQPQAPDAQPAAPQLDARAQAADAVVKKEGEEHPWGRAVDDTILNLLHGTPLGSFTDEASAGMSAAAHKITGGRVGQSYDDAKAYEDARNRALDANSKTLGNIPTPFGDLPVTTNGLTQLGGALASAPFIPAIKAMQGASALPRAVNNIATGGLLGGIYGLGQEEGDGRVANAVRNLEVGAVAGGILPPIANAAGKVAGNITGGVINQIQRTPQALKTFHPESVSKIAKAMEADNPTGDALFASPQVKLPDGKYLNLDDRGMLADAGETLRSYASGFSARPDTRAIVTNPLRTRTAQAPDIIADSVDGAFGTNQNIPELIDTTHAAINAQAKPFYDQFHATPIILNQQIKTVLRRIKTEMPGAVSGAKNLAVADGHDLQFKISKVDNPMSAMTGVKSQVSEPVPMGIEMDYLKRFVDNAANSEKTGSNEQRIYRNLARDLRETVDRSLSPSDPKLSPWAQARAITEPGFDFRNAVDEGRTAFRKGTSPDQLAYDMKSDNVAEKSGRMIGLRADIADQMGNKATAFGPKGDTAARQLFNSDYAGKKIDMLALPHRADHLHNTVSRENLYAETHNAVLGGPPTAQRLTFDKEFPRPNDKTVSPLHNAKAMLFHPAQKIFELATRGAVTERNIKIATDAAKMIMAQGADRDAIVQGLRTYLNNSNLGAKQRVAVTRIANTLAYGARTLAIQARPQSQPGENRP